MKTLIKGTIHSAIVLGAGFLGYNAFNKEYAFKKNDFVSQQPQKIKSKSICVIGGGIMGVQTAYKFLENGYNVDLFERRSEVCLENSYQNGANLSKSNFYRYVTKKQLATLLTNTINNLINPNDPRYANRIQIKALFEQNFINFGLNALRHLYKVQGLHEEKIYKLSTENSILYDEFMKKHPQFNHQSGYIKGGIQLFQKKSDYHSFLDIYQILNSQGKYEYKEAIGHEEIKKLYQNDFSSDHFQNYYGALLYKDDTNMDSYEFNSELIKMLQMRYPEQFKLHINTEVKKFIINENTSKVVGITTDKDKQLTQNQFWQDNIFMRSSFWLAALIQKNSQDFYNVNCQLLMSKDIRFPQKVSLISHQKIANHNDIPCIADEYNIKQSSTFISRLKDSYRVCGYGQISGEDSSIDQNLIQSLVHELKKFKKTKIDIDELNSWAGFRPQSPDDIPIISKIPKYDNVYLNVGQGGRGIIWSFISSQKLFEIAAGIDPHEEYSVTRFILI